MSSDFGENPLFFVTRHAHLHSSVFNSHTHRGHAPADGLTSHTILSIIEHMSYPWIRASEISEYVFCRRAWWLKRARGVRPQNVRQLEAGTRHHQAHGRLVARSHVARRAAYAVLFVAVALLVFELLSV